MGLAQVIQKQMSKVREMHAKRVREAEARASAKLAKARGDLERQRVKLQLMQEKANLSKELYEAQAALRNTRIAVNKARIEAGDLTVGERLGKAGRDIAGSVLAKDLARAGKALFTADKSRPKPRKRATAKRTATHKKTR